MLQWIQPPLSPRPALPFIRAGAKSDGSLFGHHRMIKIRKISLWLCLSGLGLLASAAPALANEVDIGFHANCVSGGVKSTLGPWFSYFPYDAYFQMPAPILAYPNWPSPF